MSLTFPEWMVTIENVTADWTLDTYEGEKPDPDELAVLIRDDSFRFSWTFKDGVAPNVREPSTFNFVLTCASPADVPEIHQGDQLVMRIQRPPGVVSRNGAGVLVGAGVDDAIDIAWQGFRVRGIASVYNRSTGRVLVSIAATDYMADLNPSVDMTYGGANFDKYDVEAVQFALYGTAMSIVAPIVRDYTTVASYLRIWGPPLGQVAVRYGGDSASPRELQILDAMNKWTLGQTHHVDEEPEMGWAGIDTRVLIVPMVVGEEAMYPFPAHSTDVVLRGPLANDRSGLLYIAVWGAYTELTTAPYELDLVGGDLSSVRVSGVEFHENDDLLIIDAAVVESSPQWESNRANAVNEWRFRGLTWDETDPQQEEFTIRDEPAITRNGPVARTIETLLVANLPPGIGGTSLNIASLDGVEVDEYPLRALEENFRDTVPAAGSDWSPAGFTVKPKLMTDAQWDAYCGRWHPTGKLQQSIAVVNVDPDENLAGDTPLFLTLTGCDIRLSGGHLLIEPKTRPIRLRVTGSAAATFADVQAAYPTVNLSDIAPGFTFGQARLTAA